MLMTLYLQVAVLAIIATLSGLINGTTAAWSALAGGLCYFLPSALTVLILNLFRSYPQYAGYAFIVGEGLRIVLALILMVTVFAVHADSLQFLPFLFGLLATSHVVFLVFWKVKRYGK